MKSELLIEAKQLTKLETEVAVEFVKTRFAEHLSREMELTKVSSPLAVLDGTGINDDLNGIERPVKFQIKSLADAKAVVIHSLAKWKRVRLQELEIEVGKGLVTDMRALRPDEDLSPIHSVLVDQWDWEKHMLHEQRSLEFLKQEVRKIYRAIKQTETDVFVKYPHLLPTLPDQITFIHSEELLVQFPELSAKDRETAAARKYGAIFIIGIGGKLAHGFPHDGRAADYDDWTTETSGGFKGLNGDIIVWHPGLHSGFELSSMGIRVDKDALKQQLRIAKCEERKHLKFHSMLFADKIPQSIGGGIGQSRMCMFMLKTKHIKEVQAGIFEV